MPCPNKTLPAWKNLVAALGGDEVAAHTVFAINSFDIPSVQLGLELWDRFTKGGKKADQATRELIKQKKLARANEQIKTLDRVILSSPKDKRLDVLNSLRANLEEYIQVLENDEATVSVSNLMGGSEIDNGEQYKNYAEFGIFIHHVIETLQKETLGTTKSLTNEFSREKLKSIFDNYSEKFEIKKLIQDGEILNIDELYRMTNNILTSIQHYVNLGHTVLPEISVMTKDRKGRNIVGRLDILTIDKNGLTNVLDVKTKKINANVVSDSLSHIYPVSAGTKADIKFLQTGNRDTYDNWDLQLGIYERMLNNIGIETNEKIILQLLYAGDFMNPQDPTKQFDELGNDTFEYNYFKNAIYLSDEQAKISATETSRFKNFMKIIKEVFPKTDETVESVSLGEKKAFIFNLNEDAANDLLNKLKEITDNQKADILKKLKQAKKVGADKALIKYYEERLHNLNKIIDSFSQTAEPAVKVGVVLKGLQVDMQNLANTVEKIKEVDTPEGLTKRAKDLETLSNISNAYNEFLTSFKNHLLDGGMSKNDKALAVLSNIESNISYIRSMYARLGFKFKIEMLKDAITPDKQERMSEQRKQAIQPKINALKRKREELAKGERSTGLWYKLINPKKLFTDNVSPETEIEKLDFEIEKLELKMKGIEFTDEGLEKYLNAIMDPTSYLYVGDGVSWTTSFIAASSSSDFLVSSYANQLKKAIFEGTKAHVNFIEGERIQQEFDEFRQGETDVTSLNERISEVRTEKKFDDDGNEEVVQKRGFANPLSEEYYYIYDSHYNSIRQLNNKIKQTNDPTELKELKKQKADLRQKHLEWELSNVQMKYVLEFYELDKLLPAEYKARRDELYEEKSLLEQSAGFNNIEQLDEDTVERIAEIEVELNKLRKEYADKEEGGLQKYFSLMEKFYNYDINQKYYDRLLNQKIGEYTDKNNIVNWDAVNKWKEQNTIKRPKEDWYIEVGALWDEIFSIIGGTNENITELREKYKEILNQYRRKGVIDTRFLSNDDIETLEQIEDLIEEYKSTSRGNKLDYDDRRRLNELFEALSDIQTKVENPFYLKEFNVRLQALDQKWSRYQQEKEDEEKNKALEQFLLEEQEFSTWYNKNHTNTYESKITNNQVLNPLPKKFNMMTVPTDDSNFIIEPDYKFRIRTIKKEALNPTFQTDALGYPMPIGLTRQGAAVEGNSKWLNPKYIQIRSNPRDAKFYNSFVSRFLAMQDETTGFNLGYSFPGYEQQSIDNYAERGLLNGLKNRIKLFRDKNLVIGSSYDYTLNNYRSDIEDRVQLKHNVTLPLDQQTRDGIGAVLRWYENAHVNVALAEVQPVSKAMIASAEAQYEALSQTNFPDKEKRLEKFRMVIEQMKFEYDKLVKGEWKKEEGLTARYADTILRGIGFTRLAFDITNQIGNLLSGNVQTFLGSHSSGLYSGKNYSWAKSKIYAWQGGLIGSLMADQGKFGGRSFMTNMFLYWNPQEKQLEDYYNRTRTTGERIAQGALDFNSGFYIQDKGELEIASTIWLAIMDATKVKLVATRDENGKPTEYLKDENGNIQTVNVFDAYTQDENGRIIIRDDVDWTKKDEQSLQNTIWAEIMRTQGNYADVNKTKMESGFKGRLLFYYRKYLVPSIRNRVGRLEDQWSSGTISYGYWRALLASLRVNGIFNTIGAIFGRSEEKTGVSDYYKMKSQMAAREFATVALMYVLALAIKGAIPDDDDDDKSFKMSRIALLNLVNIYAKVQRETSSLTPIPIMGGLRSYIETFGEFTNANKDVGRILRSLEHGIFLLGAQISDDEYWQKKAYYQKKYGPFEKGEAKIKKDLMDLTGWMNIFDAMSPELRNRLWQQSL